MNELQAILARLENLSPDEQAQVQQWINQQCERRAELRKKELWGNVVAAISKYEKEIEDIIVYCPCCGEEYALDTVDKNRPGYLANCG